MYVIIGKEKGNQCNILKNLLDEKGIQCHYVDVSEIPHELLTYLRMYCNTYPIVLGVKYSGTFIETLEHFKDVWIPASQEDFFLFKKSLNFRLFLKKKHYLSIRGIKKNDPKKRGGSEKF